MSPAAKGVASVGLGGLAAILTNGVMVAKVSPVTETGEESFWFKYRWLFALLASGASAAVLWKVWDSEHALLALAGGLVGAGAPPINDYVATEIREPSAAINYPALTGHRKNVANVQRLAAANAR